MTIDKLTDSYWKFRIRFNIDDRVRLNSGDAELEIWRDDLKQITLHAGAKDAPISGSPRMKLYGSPFSSEAEAWNAALRAKKALVAWAVKNRVGLDLLQADSRPGPHFTEEGRSLITETFGRPIRLDKHGIDVFEVIDGLQPGFLSGGEVNVTLRRSSDLFVDHFQERYVDPVLIDDRLLLACEIFCASFFDSSPRSRFITLLTAVEAILEPIKKSEAAVELVNGAIDAVTKSTLNRGEKASLVKGLERLRQEGYGATGRKLAAKVLGSERRFAGKKPKDFFYDCYDVRGQIVHTGSPDNPDLNMEQLAGDCCEFVGELLMSLLYKGPF